MTCALLALLGGNAVLGPASYEGDLWQPIVGQVAWVATLVKVDFRSDS